MRVQPVSEDSGRYEIDFPDYHVFFFERAGRRLSEGGTFPTATFTYVVSDAHNVHEVFAWADANAFGRSFIIYAVVDVPGERGVVRVQLSGSDPNRPGDPHRSPHGSLAEGSADDDLVRYVREIGQRDDFTLRGEPGPISQAVKFERP